VKGIPPLQSNNPSGKMPLPPQEPMCTQCAPSVHFGGMFSRCTLGTSARNPAVPNGRPYTQDNILQQLTVQAQLPRPPMRPGVKIGDSHLFSRPSQPAFGGPRLPSCRPGRPQGTAPLLRRSAPPTMPPAADFGLVAGWVPAPLWQEHLAVEEIERCPVSSTS
jgi:hypothetical protein